MTIRVLVAAEDVLARAGLATILMERSEPPLTITGQLSSADLVEAEIAKVYLPNVIVWDMASETVTNLDRLAEWETRPAPVIALLPEPVFATDAWGSGARGIFLRGNLNAVSAGLGAVSAGLVVIDPALSVSLLPMRERLISPTVEALTPREQEVLQLLVEGLTNKAIARRLSISESTVKFHLNAILSKLGAQSRTDAVVRATRAGLVVI
jgi:DNA-binding NarL/FixJ family response regulator